MVPQRKIFVVDDEPGMLRYMQTMLELEGIAVETSADALLALQKLRSGYAPDLILLDLLMPTMDGLDALAEIMKINPRSRVVILSCISDTAKVVQAMRLGAADYLTKPFQKTSFDAVLQRFCAPKHAEPVCDVIPLADGDVFIAASEQMNRIRAEVELIAHVDIPVLILGESGTGKEVIAKLLRDRSSRSDQPFIKVNCAALPGDLLESELFGYEAGAFTGASKAKAGKFELCDGGIIFLDEIGELPVGLQAKLLHVLQDGEFSRLGSRSSKRVNVRVLAATNIDVQGSIANKTFREDLYYRLAAFTIQLPPLRERKHEVPSLLKHMMGKLAEEYGCPPVDVSPKLLNACIEYHWPGNVRELSNFIKRFLVLRDESLALEELRVSPAAPAIAPASERRSPADMRRQEATMIMEALQQFNGNKRLAASSLKMSYNVFLQKEKEYRKTVKASATSA